MGLEDIGLKPATAARQGGQENDMGHTPGPWSINPIAAQVDAFDGPTNTPLPVCQMLWPTEQRGELETAANARLIAAAPALLEACEELLTDMQMHGDPARALEMIAKAVAKATRGA